MTLASVGDHLWQTTLVMLAAAFLARIVGTWHPRVRYAIWCTASVKFLVPLSVLIAVGHAVARWGGPMGSVSRISTAVQTIGQPFATWAEASVSATSGVEQFASPLLVAVWLVGGAVTLGVRWVRWRRTARVAAHAPEIVRGREADALRRVLTRMGVTRRVTIHESVAPGAPGLFGIVHPRLLWPAGLSPQMSDDGIDAIVTHEVCHLRRADNLTSLVHMGVETLFWFHPAVWWLGARLIDEREHACDQAVLSLGTRAQTYAESLLQVCRFCLRAPRPFVTSSTSSSLTHRVEAIMSYRDRSSLGAGRRILVAVAAILMVVGPVAAGCVGAPAPSQGVAPSASVPHADPGVTASPRGPQSPGTTVASENAEDVEFARGTVAWDTPGLTLPKVVHEVHPSYTAAAMRAKIEGKVLLEVVVLPDGTVGRARILKSLDAALGLDTQALTAARQWTFTPAAVNGTPVTVRCVMSMSFRVV